MYFDEMSHTFSVSLDGFLSLSSYKAIPQLSCDHTQWNSLFQCTSTLHCTVHFNDIVTNI